MDIAEWDKFQHWAGTWEVNPVNPRYLFRGQASAKWCLQPSLLRAYCVKCAASEVEKRRKLVHLEQIAWQVFSQRSKAFLRPVPGQNDLVGWWTYLQHYGVPTRLLDWTALPYVALYFAAREEHEDDGAVWVMNRAEVIDAMRRLYDTEYQDKYGALLRKPEKGLTCSEYDGSYLPPIEDGHQIDELWNDIPAGKPKLHTFCQSVQTERMAHQQSWFSICPDPLASHDDIMQRLSGNKLCEKVVISRGAKQTFLDELADVGVTESAVFPDLDGLGREIWGILEREARNAPP